MTAGTPTATFLREETRVFASSMSLVGALRPMAEPPRSPPMVGACETTLRDTLNCKVHRTARYADAHRQGSRRGRRDAPRAGDPDGGRVVRLRHPAARQ